MTLEKLYRKDLRLIGICLVVAAVSLYVGVKYFFQAFPEASIEFRTTKEESVPIAKAFLARVGLRTAGYRHAAVFDYDDDAKVFLEREAGVEQSARLLDSTVRLWRWEHRWFRSLEKEEILVSITTKGEPVGFEHLLAEDAAGADLPAEQARLLSEDFLARIMQRPLAQLAFVEGKLEKRPQRTDHTFTWKVAGSEVKGADYRIEVGVAGERIASYREYLKVPEAWARDYDTLRSKNLVASTVDAALMLLTGVAMLVLLVLKIRGVDLRWKAAGALGAITSVLGTLSTLNALPSDMFAYDTTTSFGGFLVQRILLSLLSGLGYGAAIFLIAAASEPLYRERFPRLLSLRALVNPRVLRTKEFFIAALTGLTLTCFFFAYENVFYIIANRFGAWAPREIAYSELLSTAFPWVFVLFFGWFPAISEEFVSRMFSIPFFERVFRSRAVAIVLAAFIWGFGHAAYPNQPFFIRGLEVGLAGIVFGLAFLRFGILSVVICHFSVDALYTAFVLLRSPSPYYVVTGSLAAGVFAILFLGAIVAYLSKGGFLPAEASNRAEGVAVPFLGAARSARAAAQAAGTGAAGMPGANAAGMTGTEAAERELRSDASGWSGARSTAAPHGEHALRARADRTAWDPAPESSAGPLQSSAEHAAGGEAAEAAEPVVTGPYRPLTGPMIAVGLALTAAFLVLGALPLPRFGDWVDFKTTKQQAQESGAVFLRGCGFDVSAYRSAAVPFDRTDPLDAAYLLEKGGFESAKQVYRERVPTPLWRVRYYVPGQPEEYSVSVDPASGSILGFARTLPEDAPGASLSRDEALALAEQFVTAHGQDPRAGELKEQTEKDEKSRRDHTLVWEYPLAGAGAARVRYQVIVQGGAVGSWTRGVKIPEDWERARSQQSVLTVILKYIKIPFLGLLCGLALVLFVTGIRAGAIPWKYAFAVGAAASLASVALAGFGLDRVWADSEQYRTSIPEALFLVGIAVSLLVSLVIFSLMGTVVGGLAGSLYPAARSIFARPSRRLFARDALLAGVATLGFAKGVPALTRVLAMLLPSGRLIESAPYPETVSSNAPAVSLLASLVFRTIFLPALGGIAVILFRRYFKSLPARAAVGALFLLAYLPQTARRPAEVLFAFLSLIIVIGSVALLARLFLRDNPLAWVWSAWFALGCLAASDLIGQSAPFYRWSGVVALVVVLLPGLWLLADAVAGGRRREVAAG